MIPAMIRDSESPAQAESQLWTGRRIMNHRLRGTGRGSGRGFASRRAADSESESESALALAAARPVSAAGH